MGRVNLTIELSERADSLMKHGTTGGSGTVGLWDDFRNKPARFARLHAWNRSVRIIWSMQVGD